QYPADRVPGDPEVPCDLLDCLAFDEVLAPNPRNCFHDQHPLTPAPNQSGKSARAHFRGSILDADPPVHGVNFARRNTYMGKSDSFDDALASFAMAYVTQTQSDYERLKMAKRGAESQR